MDGDSLLSLALGIGADTVLFSESTASWCGRCGSTTRTRWCGAPCRPERHGHLVERRQNRRRKRAGLAGHAVVPNIRAAPRGQSNADRLVCRRAPSSVSVAVDGQAEIRGNIVPGKSTIGRSASGPLLVVLSLQTMNCADVASRRGDRATLTGCAESGWILWSSAK